jgi:hypothetical protein
MIKHEDARAALGVPARHHRIGLMPYGPAERKYHTRVGWWFMTHDRGGSVAVGGFAGLLFAADVAYLAARWRGLDDPFDRGFLLGFGVLVLTIVGMQALGLNKPIGADRRRARLRASATNVVGVAAIGTIIFVSGWLGRHAMTGALLGELASCACLFAAFSGWWLARSPVARRGT